jgi:hypothetical protein
VKNTRKPEEIPRCSMFMSAEDIPVMDRATGRARAKHGKFRKR